MSEERVVYRNARWNGRVAPYMAFQGAVFLGAVPALLIWVVLDEGPVAVAVMLAMLGVGALVPLLRTLRGRVIIDGGDVVVVNPFRNVRVPLERVTGFGDAPLQQNLFIVAVLQVEDPEPRLVKVIPVPGVDGPELERLLTTA